MASWERPAAAPSAGGRPGSREDGGDVGSLPPYLARPSGRGEPPVYRPCQGRQQSPDSSSRRTSQSSLTLEGEEERVPTTGQTDAETADDKSIRKTFSKPSGASSKRARDRARTRRMLAAFVRRGGRKSWSGGGETEVSQAEAEAQEQLRLAREELQRERRQFWIVAIPGVVTAVGTIFVAVFTAMDFHLKA